MGARGAGGPRCVRSGRSRPIGGLKAEFRRHPGLALKGARGVRCRSVLTDRPFMPTILTIAVILLVLWALGLVTSHTMGGFIHLPIVVAVVLVLVRVIQGRAIA